MTSIWYSLFILKQLLATKNSKGNWKEGFSYICICDGKKNLKLAKDRLKSKEKEVSIFALRRISSSPDAKKHRKTLTCQMSFVSWTVCIRDLDSTLGKVVRWLKGCPRHSPLGLNFWEITIREPKPTFEAQIRLKQHFFPRNLWFSSVFWFASSKGREYLDHE